MDHRPVETPVAPVPVKEPTPSPAVSDTELVDTAYVEAHPHETFHHRGQGRWDSWSPTSWEPATRLQSAGRWPPKPNSPSLHRTLQLMTCLAWTSF